MNELVFPTEIKVEDEELIILRESDILAKKPK